MPNDDHKQNDDNFEDGPFIVDLVEQAYLDQLIWEHTEPKEKECPNIQCKNNESSFICKICEGTGIMLYYDSESDNESDSKSDNK